MQAVPIIRSLIIQTARRIAADPRARAKAAELLETEVKPRAASAWRQAKPRFEAAREELRDISAQAHPLDDPKGFALKLKDRIRDIQRRGD